MASLDSLQTLADFRQELLARVSAARQALSQPGPAQRETARQALEDFRDYPALPTDALRDQAQTAVGAMWLTTTIAQALATLQQLQQQLGSASLRGGAARPAARARTASAVRGASKRRLAPPRPQAAYGTFSDDPQVVWLTAPADASDRQMQLLREFWFTDPAGTVWRAPAGSVVDGASIPAPLWSTIGSPYTGHYRRASIVHDVACAAAVHAPDPPAARAAADQMFYQACLAGGCPPAQAELLYVGVRIGAWLLRIPLWQQLAQRQPLLSTDRTLPAEAEESIRTTYREIAADVQRTAPATFAALDALVSRHLAAKAAQPLPALPGPKRQLAPRPPLGSEPLGEGH